MKKFIIAALFLPFPAFAQTKTAQTTYVISAPLVEEIFQRLSTASLVAMLAGEVQHQPPPVACPEAIPPEPPSFPPPDASKQ